MNNSYKNSDIIEKFKRALTSTAKAISDDFNIRENLEKNKYKK